MITRKTRPAKSSRLIVTLSALAVVALTCCGKSDKPEKLELPATVDVGAEYAALLAAPHEPVFPSSAPLDPQSRAAVVSVHPLLAEADRSRTRFDEPLPASVLELAGAMDLVAAAQVWAELMRAPEQLATSVILAGPFGALLFDLADLRLANGDIEGAYELVVAALGLYADAPPGSYVWYFQPTYFFSRLVGMLQGHPPSKEVAATLKAATAAAAMTERRFCSGMREEMLLFAGVHFVREMPEQRAAILQRWGPAVRQVLEAVPAGRPVAPKAWQLTRALIQEVSAACDAGITPPQIHQQAQPALEALVAADDRIATWMRGALNRAKDFAHLQAARGQLLQVLEAAAAPPATP